MRIIVKIITCPRMSHQVCNRQGLGMGRRTRAAVTSRSRIGLRNDWPGDGVRDFMTYEDPDKVGRLMRVPKSIALHTWSDLLEKTAKR